MLGVPEAVHAIFYLLIHGLMKLVEVPLPYFILVGLLLFATFNPLATLQLLLFFFDFLFFLFVLYLFVLSLDPLLEQLCKVGGLMQLPCSPVEVFYSTSTMSGL